MNDIGLLITTALTTGHPSVPYLFNEIAVELDFGVKESNLIQSTGLITPARITPPEFIQSSGIQIASKVILQKNENVLKKIRDRIESFDCCHLEGHSVSVTKQPIVLKKYLEHNSLEAANRIIFPSTSPPTLTDAIENTPQLKQIQAGASKVRQVNSGKVISNYNQSLPILSFGTSGLSVRVLQRLLLVNGYPIRVDGNFGALTEIAVKAFQSDRNLATDGVVGLQTWQQLTR
ncbi:peptidoglycan-binding domain-containing protein [Rivularia sp. UHCC 0363]|uniref:peptidoglycan-binding domain-containing protein n=1 Tax=Rivularia sp. UHCC 0363 TaxID=3110244 RepID=UPI002B200A9C|nr:peptidoglycan-binding domain-containing protein [Rivularia sp. UHCC 0363]MEA5592915.1 peptidoglycan-binding domain-containing protein [Rivularia sp. UHCC 0363]